MIHDEDDDDRVSYLSSTASSDSEEEESCVVSFETATRSVTPVTDEGIVDVLSRSPDPMHPTKIANEEAVEHLLQGGNKELTLRTKLKVAQLKLFKKQGRNQINTYLRSEGFKCVDRTQIRKYVNSLQELFNEVEAGHGDKLNLGGQGRPCSVSVSEYDELKRRLSYRVENNIRTSKAWIREAMEDICHSTISDYQLNSFIKKHAIKMERPFQRVAVTEEEIIQRVKRFHVWSAQLNGVLNLDASKVVQMDEIAVSMSGYLGKQNQKFLTGVGKCHKPYLHHITDLDDEKKMATAICFLSENKIPPLVVFKGKGTKIAAEEKLLWKLPCIYTEKGNTTAKSYSEHIIPHIRKYAPAVRVVVHDAALSHVCDEVDAALEANGINPLKIPKKCTQFVQALDVYFFAEMRRIHSELVHRLCDNHAPNLFKGIRASRKRIMLTQLVSSAYELTLQRAMPTSQMFTVLGYLNPSSESISLTKLPQYTFPTVDSHTFSKLVNDLYAPFHNPHRDIINSEANKIAENFSETQLPLKKDKKKSERPVGRPKKCKYQYLGCKA
eukprot:PhF_6_TR1040/c3_g1_i3/m.2140